MSFADQPTETPSSMHTFAEAFSEPPTETPPSASLGRNDNRISEENKFGWVDGEWQLRNNSLKKQSGWVSEGGLRYKTVPIVESKLPSGVYTFAETDHGMFFEKQMFSSDEAVRLPGLPCDLILNQILNFWDSKELYQKYGLLHKRGIMLYGTPGCGKTSIIRLLCNEILSIGGIVFSISSYQRASVFCRIFRNSEPTRPILTIQEDMEGIFEGSNGADEVKAALSFLDGQDQVNNIVHVASSNQPEKIADRFIKRPGRFDLVIGINEPTDETREAYLRHVCKDQIAPDQLHELVRKTNGLGLVYLREIAASYLCLDIPIDETINRMKSNFKTKVFKNKQNSPCGYQLGYE